MRTRSLKTPATTIVAELKEALSAEFQVVLESNHIHVEYDPA
jgi:hypothetical protein